MKLRSRAILSISCGALCLLVTRAVAHDVPNRFFDRAVQVAVEPGAIHVLYDLSVSELTLAEELMALVGPDGLAQLPADRWLERFAQEMADLLAGGVLVEANGAEVPLKPIGFNYDTFEGHPRFRFRFDGKLPELAEGEELFIQVEDTNFFLERGAVRMALCPLDGTELLRSSAPWTVDEVRVRPGWQMTPEEADAARRIDATLRIVTPGLRASNGTDQIVDRMLTGAERQSEPRGPAGQSPASTARRVRLRELLAPEGPVAMVLALLAAFGVGAAHALTPGHGKTVAAAFLVAQRGSLAHALGLAATIVVTHTGAVFAAAAVLAIIDPALDRTLGRTLALVSGLLVVVVGSLLLAGRIAAARRGDRRAVNDAPRSRRRLGWLGVASIGAAAGMVPCWDGVALLLWAVAVGRTGWGLVLLTAFTLGLAAVLVGIAVMVVKIPRLLGLWSDAGERLGRYLSIAAALVIVAVGCILTWNAWVS